MMRKWVLFVWLIAQMGAIFGVEKRMKQVNYSVSVAVPCHYLHVKYLKRLLEAYQHQTVLPLEIIVSISQANLVEHELAEIKKLQWPFPVFYLETNDRLGPGGNRNRATSQASGNVILFQDADDLPHKQRVEIVKYLFEKYKIHHLIHRFTPFPESFSQREIQPKYITIHDLKSAREAFMYFSRIQFGQCAVSKKAASEIAWESNQIMGEDLKFCDSVIHQLGCSVVIDTELVNSETSGLPGLIQQGLL